MATQITSAESSRKLRDKGAVYQSECFGSLVRSSNDDSDTECAGYHERNCPLAPRRKKEQWLACHNCDTWYHWSCAGIKSKNKLKEIGASIFNYRIESV